MSYRAAADELYKAMKGFGTDEKKIIQVLGSLPHDGRVAIAGEFQAAHGKSLEKELDSELSGNFRSTCKRLAKSIPEVKADHLHDAMAGLGTKESAVIDTITQSTNYELQAISQVYSAKYGKSLADVVKGDTSGHFEKILLALLSGRKDENPYPNEAQAEADADALYKGGEKKFGTDDDLFVNIMTTRSAAQLDATNRHYTRKYGKSLQHAIESETSGDYGRALIALTKTRDVYFTERLVEAFKGLGTNDALLVYIMTAHDKVTLQWIATTYGKITQTSLQKSIEKETSGDYEKILVALLH